MLLWLILVFSGILIISVKTRIIYIYEKAVTVDALEWPVTQKINI